MRQTLLAIAIALTTIFTGCTHQYVVQDCQTPQSNGTIAHDYARVDLTTGTMCGVQGPFWYNDAMVPSCQ